MSIDMKEIISAQLNKLGNEIEALLEVEKAARDFHDAWAIGEDISGPRHVLGDKLKQLDDVRKNEN